MSGNMHPMPRKTCLMSHVSKAFEAKAPHIIDCTKPHITAVLRPGSPHIQTNFFSTQNTTLIVDPAMHDSDATYAHTRTHTYTHTHIHTYSIV